MAKLGRWMMQAKEEHEVQQGQYLPPPSPCDRALMGTHLILQGSSPTVPPVIK
jgi:hypothetical protein